MQDLIVFFLYLVLLVFLSTKLYKDLYKGWTIENFFISLIILFYVFIPITMVLYEYLLFLDYTVPDLKVNYNDKKYYSYMTLFVTIVFLVFFYIGKTAAINRNKKVLYSIKIRRIKIGKFSISIILILAYFFSFLSIASLLLYVSQFGSFQNAIIYSNMVRSGYGDEVFVSTTYVFVKRFINFALFTILIYFFIEKRKNIINMIFLLIVPLSVTIFFKVFISSGKQGIISLFLIILFYFSLKYKKAYLNIFAIFLASMIILLPLLDYIFLTKTDYYSKGFDSSISFIDFLGFFSFPQVALQFSINNIYDYFYINDFIYGLKGTILPFSWLSDWTTDTMLYNTKLFYGHDNRGIVPPGLFAFAFYSFGIIAIVIVAFITGYLIKKTDNIFQSIIINNNKFIVFYAFTINLMYTAVRTGLPKYNFYHTVFITFAVMLLISFVVKKHIEYK